MRCTAARRPRARWCPARNTSPTAASPAARSSAAAGIEYVYASGSAYDTTVDRGGAAVASSGGLLSGTALHAGGTETIYSGGVADATVVGSGGTEFVLAGGVDNGTVVSGGGTEAVYSGAVIEGIALQSGGAIDLPDLPFGSGGSAVLNAQTNLLTITEGGSSRQVQLTGINSGFTSRSRRTAAPARW